MSDNIDSIVGGDENSALNNEPGDPGNPAPADPGSKESVAADPAPKDPSEAKVVPLAALHEERNARKQLQQRLAQIEQEQKDRDAKLQARLDALTRRDEPQPPAFEADPAGYLRHQVDGLAQTMAERQKQEQAERQQREQATAQQQHIQRLAAHVNNSEAAFAQQNPDYNAAVEHLKNVRVRELTEGFGLDPMTASQKAQQELIEFALHNAAQGVNPAEAAYRIAAVRGYQKAAPAQPGATPAEKLATQQKGQAAAKSLGGGGAPAGKMTVESLLSMSDEEFAAATQGDKWMKVAGG